MPAGISAHEINVDGVQARRPSCARLRPPLWSLHLHIPGVWDVGTLPIPMDEHTCVLLNVQTQGLVQTHTSSPHEKDFSWLPWQDLPANALDPSTPTLLRAWLCWSILPFSGQGTRAEPFLQGSLLVMEMVRDCGSGKVKSCSLQHQHSTLSHC